METAARTDRKGASATAAAEKDMMEGRRRRAWQGGDSVMNSQLGAGGAAGVNPDEFEPLLYAQLALTSPPIEPDDCRCVCELTLGG